MKMFLTRDGENVTVIVNGDVSQCDLRAMSRRAGRCAAPFRDDVWCQWCLSQDDCVLRSSLLSAGIAGL